ncbi:nickel/cobalt transporter [Longispora urticae]
MRRLGTGRRSGERSQVRDRWRSGERAQARNRWRSGGRWFGVLGAVLVGSVLLGAAPAGAHPLGNFTTNQYAGLTVDAAGTTIDYVLDLAELPAYQLRQQLWHDAAPTAGEADAYAAGECARIADAVRLTVGDRRVPVAVTARTVTFPAGTAGLTTLRLECRLRADTPVTTTTELGYSGDAYPDRIGWREVTAVGDAVTLTASDVPGASPSNRLTAYPEQQLSSPSDIRAAHLTATPGGTAAPPAAHTATSAQSRGIDRLTLAFTDFIGRPKLTLTIGVLAVLIALVLGAAHALAPGHGKTVMAAYLVAQRGSLRHAGVIAATVTLTHTGGVMILGLLLSTTLAFAPQRVYGWLGLASGVLLAAVGTVLLYRAWRGHGFAHGHHHGPGGHTHGPDGHHHGHDGHTHGPGGHDHPAGHTHGSDGHHHGPPDTHGHRSELVGAHAAGASTQVEASHHHAHGHSPARIGGHDAEHGHDDVRAHAAHDHHHDHESGPRARSALSLFTVTAMGFAGGLVPSPSAVVVLLGAIALGRTWFGVILVLGYGLGMAATLVGIGFLLARWRHRLEPRLTGRTGTLVRRFAPLATSGLVVVVGLCVAARAVVSL